MSAITERETISVVRTTPGSWEGTFQVVLTVFLTDILADGTAEVRVQHLSGRVIAGNLVAFNDDVLTLELDYGRLMVPRDEIVSVTL